VKKQIETSVAPIALGRDEGEALWFTGFRAEVKAGSATTAGRLTVIEHLGTQGLGSPLHVHSREDEWFYVIEGELTIWVGGRTIAALAGSFVYGPRGIPHTFVVASEQARFLVVTEPGGFDGFMRALSVPATAAHLPPPGTPVPPLERMMALAAEYGIDIIGPPGIPV
jgi:quercetin dioxygenase-like cupin family protein